MHSIITECKVNIYMPITQSCRDHTEICDGQANSASDIAGVLAAMAVQPGAGGSLSAPIKPLQPSADQAPRSGVP